MRNVLFWGIGKYSGLSNLEFEMKQKRSFRNICSIYLCPKKVHGILLIESYIIQRLNVEKKNKKNKGTKNIKHTYMMKKKPRSSPAKKKKSPAVGFERETLRSLIQCVPTRPICSSSGNGLFSQDIDKISWFVISP